MSRSWITLYPELYADERRSLARAYPQFRVHEPSLSKGHLILFGQLLVRPPDGTKSVSVSLAYPAATPFEKPVVTPIEEPVEFLENGFLKKKPNPKFFDRRHQMSSGSLCLFQRETRVPGGDIIGGVDTLKRAERWLLGQITGHMPPDSADSELQEHFCRTGDVLLGEAFFAETFGPSGRFYMVPDLRRYHETGKPELSAFIVTSLTIEESVVTPIDAREDLSRLYPWIENDLWDPMKVADIESRPEDGPKAFERGYWWQLSSEPDPFHNGAGFLSVIEKLVPGDTDPWQRVSRALGTDLSTEARLFLALRYPGRTGEPEWLVISLAQKGRSGADGLLIRSDAEKRRDFEESEVCCLRTHTARPSTLRLRNTGVVEASMSEKTVALIGLGALGSKVAELLAQAGVGAFGLCDSDRVATGNVARHIAGLSAFGLPKVEVVGRRLLEINPRVDLTDDNVVFGSAVNSLDDLSNFIDSADLTIATTADESTEAAINQLAVILDKPVLYGRSLRRGSMGRVFLVRPRRDACHACYASYAAGEGKAKPPLGWIPVHESPDDILIHECGRPVIPASAADLAIVAALIARIAIDFLEGRDQPSNHWLWSRFAIPELHDGLSNPFSTVTTHCPPRPGCRACREPEIDSLVLTEEVREQIIQLTESSPGAETCGVLIGYVNSEHQAVAVRATGPGPKATQSASICRRDVDYVQAELEMAALELGDHGKYIGEWHSHLESDPHPSSTDIDSLVGIAHAQNYLSRCPVMVIAGLDPSDSRVHILRSWVFPIGGRMYSIENTTA